MGDLPRVAPRGMGATTHRWRNAIVGSSLMALCALAVILHGREDTVLAAGDDDDDSVHSVAVSQSHEGARGAARSLLMEDNAQVLQRVSAGLTRREAHTVLSNLISERHALEKLLKKKKREQEVEEEADHAHTKQEQQRLASQERFLISAASGDSSKFAEVEDEDSAEDDSVTQHNVELDEEEVEAEQVDKLMEQRAREQAADKMLVDKYYRQYKEGASKTVKKPAAPTQSVSRVAPDAVQSVAPANAAPSEVPAATRSPSTPSVTVSPRRDTPPQHATMAKSKVPKAPSKAVPKRSSLTTHKIREIQAAIAKLKKPKHHIRHKTIPKQHRESPESAKPTAAAHDSTAKVHKVKKHTAEKTVPPLVMQETAKAAAVVPQMPPAAVKKVTKGPVKVPPMPPAALAETAKAIVPEPIADGPAESVVKTVPEEPPVIEEPPVLKIPKMFKKETAPPAPEPEIEDTDASSVVTTYIIWGTLGLLVVGMLGTVMCLACQPDRNRPWGMPPKRSYA